MKKRPIIVDFQTVLNRIEEIQNSLDTSEKRKMVNKVFYTGQLKGTRRQKDYQLIYKILEKEYGASPISKVGIWRFLKIKESSLSLYREVKEERLSIRNAFDLLSNKKPDIQKMNIEKPDIEKLISELSILEKDLSLNQIKISEKQLKELDEQLFKTRKALGKTFANNFIDDEVWRLFYGFYIHFNVYITSVNSPTYVAVFDTFISWFSSCNKSVSITTR